MTTADGDKFAVSDGGLGYSWEVQDGVLVLCVGDVHSYTWTGNGGDNGFVNAFVTASLTVCIGAMAIVGAIQDGILGDYSTLAVKAVLDLIIIAVMTSSMGKGAVFSAIPVFLFEGAVTLLARLVSPIMTELAIAYLSLIGSVLIFCVGVNLVWGKTLRVANMLPAVVLAVLAAYLPWGF